MALAVVDVIRAANLKFAGSWFDWLSYILRVRVAKSWQPVWIGISRGHSATYCSLFVRGQQTSC